MSVRGSSEEKYLLTNLFVRSTGGREFYVWRVPYLTFDLGGSLLSFHDLHM